MSESKPNYAGRPKTVFRVNKDKDNPFVMIDRRPIENPLLSWKAKGVLAYLLSRPDNWIVQFRDLVNRSTDGGHAVRQAVKELKEAGHIVVKTDREGGKITRWTYEVHEVPLLSDFQQVENLEVENQLLNDIDLNETELNDIGTKVPSDFPIDWQIAAGQEVTQHDKFIAQARDAANLMDMGCLGASELAYAFMTARKILIPESKIKGNRKAAREMMEMGVKAEHVRRATLDLMEKNMTVTDLFSVSKTAIDLANKPVQVQEYTRLL